MNRVSALILLVAVSVSAAVAQNAPATPQTAGANTDPTYVALRNVALSGDHIVLENVIFKKDAGTFTLNGNLYPLAAVEGRVTGAVFIGQGKFDLTPPLPIEQRSLSQLTKSSSLTETFTTAVFRFTDKSYEELQHASKPQPGSSSDAAGALSESKDIMRHRLSYNLDGRLLEDVMDPSAPGAFYAFIKGQNISSRILYVVDPQSVPAIEARDQKFAAGVASSPMYINVYPDEVALIVHDENKFGVWTSFHLAGEYANGTARSTQDNGPVKIDAEELDTQIQKSAYLVGDAKTTITAKLDGVRVVPFNLYRTLRISKVTGASGEPLAFIQEDKDLDPQYYVVLPRPLKAGEQYIVRTQYEGKDAVLHTGAGNYFPVARENWYPATVNATFGAYAAYKMSFAIPKGMQMVATGTADQNVTEGDQNLTKWHSEVPQVVAGFNFGKFTRKEVAVEKVGYHIESYANETPPDWVVAIQHAGDNTGPENASDCGRLMGGCTADADFAIGNLGTTDLSAKPLAEAQVSVQIYTDYFGPAPYKHVAMTQQTACNFGQSWPTLVYIPICSFFDSTVRHTLGMDDTRGYWEAVGPHEVAHQWWGHLVGFNGYRDQWMSEGFADFSAGLFLQMIYKKPDQYLKFWNDERWLLTQKNYMGNNPMDYPLVLGYRNTTSKSGVDIPRRLIYPKGAYILQMIRWMMYDSQNGDKDFKAMMHDFTQTYANKPASTEDFKAMVEKHMTPEMNLTRNGKMDWFFNEYVYGTYLPNYHFEYSFGKEANGAANVHVKLVQSNVDQNFGMLVPLYLEMSNGKIIRVGSAPMVGNTTLDQTIPLTGIKETPKRAMVNYYYDVLATTN